MSFPTADFKRLSLEDFDVLKETLGVGNFCEVIHCVLRGSKNEVALKKIRKSQAERLNKEKDVLMEKHVLQRYV